MQRNIQARLTNRLYKENFSIKWKSECTSHIIMQRDTLEIIKISTRYARIMAALMKRATRCVQEVILDISWLSIPYIN